MNYLGIISRGVLGSSTDKERAVLATSFGLISTLTTFNFVEIVSLFSEMTKGVSRDSIMTKGFSSGSVFTRLVTLESKFGPEDIT